MKNSCASEAFGDKTVREFHLTIIDSRTLLQRLMTEISFAAWRARRLWPEFKKDPIGFGLRVGVSCRERALSSWQQPNSLTGRLTAVGIVSLVLGLALIDVDPSSRSQGPVESDEIITKITLTLPAPLDRIGHGIGAESQGRVGVASGSGEGSKPERSRSRGGGGSGNLDKLMPQRGGLFPPSQIPAILPTLLVRKNPALPMGGMDIDPQLWKVQTLLQYGDPRSPSPVPSRGPGEGENFGSGKGAGTGEGIDSGFGPGEKGNTGGGANSRGGPTPGVLTATILMILTAFLEFRK